MIDLYKWLGVARLSSTEAIRVAVSYAPNGGRRDDAEYILLNDERKRSYDIALEAVEAVAIMRPALKVSASKFWQVEDYKDFHSHRDSLMFDTYVADEVRKIAQAWARRSTDSGSYDQSRGNGNAGTATAAASEQNWLSCLFRDGSGAHFPHRPPQDRWPDHNRTGPGGV